MFFNILFSVVILFELNIMITGKKGSTISLYTPYLTIMYHDPDMLKGKTDFCNNGTVEIWMAVCRQVLIELRKYKTREHLYLDYRYFTPEAARQKCKPRTVEIVPNVLEYTDLPHLIEHTMAICPCRNIIVPKHNKSSKENYMLTVAIFPFLLKSLNLNLQFPSSTSHSPNPNPQFFNTYPQFLNTNSQFSPLTSQFPHQNPDSFDANQELLQLNSEFLNQSQESSYPNPQFFPSISQFPHQNSDSFDANQELHQLNSEFLNQSQESSYPNPQFFPSISQFPHQNPDSFDANQELLQLNSEFLNQSQESSYPNPQFFPSISQFPHQNPDSFDANQELLQLNSEFLNQSQESSYPNPQFFPSISQFPHQNPNSFDANQELLQLNSEFLYQNQESSHPNPQSPYSNPEFQYPHLQFPLLNSEFLDPYQAFQYPNSQSPHSNRESHPNPQSSHPNPQSPHSNPESHPNLEFFQTNPQKFDVLVFKKIKSNRFTLTELYEELDCNVLPHRALFTQPPPTTTYKTIDLHKMYKQLHKVLNNRHDRSSNIVDKSDKYLFARLCLMTSKNYELNVDELCEKKPDGSYSHVTTSDSTILKNDKLLIYPCSPLKITDAASLNLKNINDSKKKFKLLYALSRGPDNNSIILLTSVYSENKESIEFEITEFIENVYEEFLLEIHIPEGFEKKCALPGNF